jgi:putative isomerase
MKKILHILLLSLLLLPVLPGRAQATRTHRRLLKEHIYADFRQMYRQPSGDALIYPYITPGSQAYANVLWDWDSWLSNVALRQTLADIGSKKDKQEARDYERGCVLNYLTYTSPDDGYMPMVIDTDSDPEKIKPADIYHTNMHKPVIAQHAAFITQQDGAMPAGSRGTSIG